MTGLSTPTLCKRHLPNNHILSILANIVGKSIARQYPLEGILHSRSSTGQVLLQEVLSICVTPSLTDLAHFR